MSRTHKDKPPHLRFETHRKNRVDHEYTIEWVRYYRTYDWKTKTYTSGDEPHVHTVWLDRGGVKRKQKKNIHTEWDWMTNPMWYNHVQTIEPQRHASKEWGKQVIRKPVEDLIDDDPPYMGRKPKEYYW